MVVKEGEVGAGGGLVWRWEVEGREGGGVGGDRPSTHPCFFTFLVFCSL